MIALRLCLNERTPRTPCVVGDEASNRINCAGVVVTVHPAIRCSSSDMCRFSWCRSPTDVGHMKRGSVNLVPQWMRSLQSFWYLFSVFQVFPSLLFPFLPFSQFVFVGPLVTSIHALFPFSFVFFLLFVLSCPARSFLVLLHPHVALSHAFLSPSVWSDDMCRNVIDLTLHHRHASKICCVVRCLL